MMIKNIKNMLIAGLVGCGGAALLTSCSDSFLDQAPDERVEIKDVKQVRMLLGTAYSTSNYHWLCEMSSDNIVDINATFMATQSNGNEIPVRFNLTSYDRMDDELYCFEPVKSSTGSDSPSDVWESFYKAIAVANHAIAILDKLKASGVAEDNEMRYAYAEAYLTRAYHHFILLNIFSQAYKNDQASRSDLGIPYVTSPEDKVSVNYDRSTVTDTYKKIEEDLIRGLEFADDISFELPKWHFNANAAHAFAARFYLYKRQYDKVIQHANFVLGSNDESGRAGLSAMLMNMVGFDDATTLVDRTEIWQGPKEPNNLLLRTTYSRQWRRSVGYRYAYAGKALRDIYYHLGPNWNYYCMRAAAVADKFYWDGNSDHGYKSCRIGERFEYTDKVANIGYAHVITRDFTCNELLLERAEAELFLNDIAGCEADLIAYENIGRQSFSEATMSQYKGALFPLTHDDIIDWYDPAVAGNMAHSNTLANWDFTQNMSSDFVVSAQAAIYMNCLNDMRRYETAWQGRRFFDLKRWGMEYSHIYGSDNVEIKLAWNDPRRALEIPQEVILAGMEPSQPIVNDGNGETGNETAADFGYTIK